MLKMYITVILILGLYGSNMDILSAQPEDVDSNLQVIEAIQDPELQLDRRINAIEGWVETNPKVAEKQVEVAMAEAKQLNQSNKVNRLLGLAAEVQLNLSEYQRADSLVQLALQACPDSSTACPPEMIAHFYNLQGHVQFRTSDFVAAGQAFQQSGEWYQRSGALERAIAARFNAGSIYMQTGASGRAIKIFTDLIEEVQDSSQLGFIYNNLGIAYSSKGELEKALTYFSQADAIPGVSPALKEQITYNLALTNEGLGHYERAVVMYQELLPIYQEKQNKRSLARTYLGLGKSYANLNQPDRARAYIEEAESAISPEEQPIEYEDLLTVKHEVYSDLGNYQAAYQALFDLKVLRDTLAVNEQRKQFAELQERYESEKKEAENQTLRVREQLHLATIENQQYGLYGSILAILLAAGILIVVLRQNRMQKRYNQKLQEKNRSIDLLHQELKHRVSNNLSFILSMLRLQKSETSDVEIQHKLQSNVDRIQAISTLYQQLDQPEEQLQVNLQNYIPDVLAPIKHSLSGQEVQPDFDVQIDSITLDPQSAMRLGIVVNELVTNSLKHAFHKVDDSVIRLSINQPEADEVLMTYEDNGTGMQENIQTEDQSSFGLSLIESLVATLNGEIRMEAEGRMKVDIRIPNSN